MRVSINWPESGSQFSRESSVPTVREISTKILNQEVYSVKAKNIQNATHILPILQGPRGVKQEFTSTCPDSNTHASHHQDTGPRSSVGRHCGRSLGVQVHLHSLFTLWDTLGRGLLPGSSVHRTRFLGVFDCGGSSLLSRFFSSYDMMELLSSCRA